MWLAGLRWISDTLVFDDLLGSKRVTRVAGSGCHSVRVAAAGWLEFGSEYRCVWRAEIEEAPDDGKWQVGSAGLAYVSLINDGA